MLWEGGFCVCMKFKVFKGSSITQLLFRTEDDSNTESLLTGGFNQVRFAGSLHNFP